MKSLTDVELIALYRKDGDMAVCAELFQRHAHLIGMMAMKYLKNRDDCEDAAMEIFEILLKDLRVHEVGNFPGWLYMVVKNHCLKRLRSAKRDTEQSAEFAKIVVPIMEIDSHPDHVDESMLKEQLLTDLELAVRKLPEEQQKCVDLFYIQQKRYKEVADLTGYSLNEVKSYIQNGKRNLKIYLTDSP